VFIGLDILSVGRQMGKRNKGLWSVIEGYLQITLNNPNNNSQ